MYFFVALVLVLFSAQSSTVCAQLEESLLQERGTGAPVVLLSVVRIRQSGIFSDDNDLLPRIAYTETRDGTASDTYRDGYHGGIWAIDESAFLSTQNTAADPSLTGIFEYIQEEFGIYWPSATWSDLRKPFYSALAARLVLFTTHMTIPAKTDVQGQANFWVRYYNPGGSNSNFTSAITSTCTRMTSHNDSRPYEYTTYYNHVHYYTTSCGWWRRCRRSYNHQHAQTNLGTRYVLVYTLKNVCCDGFQGTPPNCYLTTIGFSETSYVFSESNSEDVQVPVVRSGDTQSTAAVVVATNMSSGTASDDDYIPVLQAVEFQPGESEKEVIISVVNDKNAEEDEIFQLYITGETGVILSPYIQTSIVITNEDHVPGQPTNLQQAVLSSSSATITWQAPALTNPHNLLLMYTLLLNEQQFGLPIITIHINASLTSYTFTQLEEFNRYTCSIYATNEVGTGIASSISFITHEDAPSSSPQNLGGGALSSTSISLSWISPSLIDQNGIIREYMVIITENETGNVLEFTSSTTTLTVSSLHPYYNYQCKVNAYTVDHGPYSEDVTVMTLEDVPSGYPENFTGIPTSSRSAIIAWNPPLPDGQNGVIIGYKITITVVETGEMFQLFSTTNDLTIDTLSPYTTYVCVIAATTSVGVGTFSNNITFQTLEDVSTSPPQNPVGVASNSRTIFLSWDLPPPRQQNGIIREYRINLTEVETGTTWQVTSITSSITIPMLHPHYTYEWCVSAFTIGDGPCTEISTVMTPEDVPTSPPQNAIGAAHTSTSIILHWDPPPIEGQNGIILMYRINITEVESGRVLWYTSDISALVVSGLHPYYTYDWAVSASTIIGYGPYTEVSTVVTLEDFPASAPQNLEAISLGSREIQFVWDPPPLEDWNGIIEFYTIQISVLNSGEELLFNSTLMNFTVSSLSPYTEYLCTVAAGTSVGIGAFAEMIVVQTAEEGPSSHPLNTTGMPLNSTHILLQWHPPPRSEHGGVIREYRINVTEHNTGRMFQFTSEVTEITIGPLHPYYIYICTIAAFTVDEGPYSDNVVVITHEDAPSGPPRNLKALTTDSRSIFLSWEPPLPEQQNGIIQHYTVTISSVETSDTISTSAMATNVNISGLRPFTSYQCSVVAHTIASGPAAIISAITSEDTPTAPPDQLQANSSDSRTLVLSWKPPANEHRNGIIRGYSIKILEVDTGRMITQMSSNATTTVTVTGLHPFYTYSSSVAAETIGLGPFSAMFAIQMPEDAPASSPVDVNSTTIESTSFLLSWNSPPPEDHNGIIRHYVVNVTEENTGRMFQMISTTTHIMLTLLHPYYNYILVVSAVTIEEGPYSVPITIITAQDAPSAPPQKLEANSVNSRALSLTWSPPPPEDQNGIIRNYLVNISVVESGEHFYQLTSNATILVIDELHPYYTYSCIVAALTVGTGPFTKVSTVQLPEDVPTGNPQDFMAVPVSSTSIQLTWRHLQPEERNGIIRSYRISVTERETGSVLNFTADETATQQIVNSLHPFYNYRCTVAAFTVGLGPSATTDVQTLPEAPSGPPTDFNVTTLSSTTLLVIWQPPESLERNGIITAYQIHVTTFGEDTSNTYMVSGNTLSLQVEGLQKFTEYVIRISAATSIGTGPNSTAVTLTTLEDVPGAPIFSEEEEGVKLLSPTAVELNWKTPESPNGIILDYQVIYVGYVVPMLKGNKKAEGGTEISDGPHTLTINDGLSAVIFGLTPGLTYDFKVRARTAVGYGDNSTVITVETPDHVGTIQEQKGGINTGTTVGLAVGATFGLLVVIVVVFAVIWCIRRERKLHKRSCTIAQENLPIVTDSLSFENSMTRDTAKASDDMPAKKWKESEESEDTHL